MRRSVCSGEKLAKLTPEPALSLRRKGCLKVTRIRAGLGSFRTSGLRPLAELALSKRAWRAVGLAEFQFQNVGKMDIGGLAGFAIQIGLLGTGGLPPLWAKSAILGTGGLATGPRTADVLTGFRDSELVSFPASHLLRWLVRSLAWLDRCHSPNPMGTGRAGSPSRQDDRAPSSARLFAPAQFSARRHSRTPLRFAQSTIPVLIYYFGLPDKDSGC